LERRRISVLVDEYLFTATTYDGTYAEGTMVLFVYYLST